MFEKIIMIMLALSLGFVILSNGVILKNKDDLVLKKMLTQVRDLSDNDNLYE